MNCKFFHCMCVFISNCSFDDDNIPLDPFFVFSHFMFVAWLVGLDGRWLMGGGYATGMERVSSRALSFSTSLSNLFNQKRKKKC